MISFYYEKRRNEVLWEIIIGQNQEKDHFSEKAGIKFLLIDLLEKEGQLGTA